MLYLIKIKIYYFSEVETVDEDDDNLNSITRSKRDADSYDYMITPTRTRCPLLLVADYRFFREMGGGDTKTTINYLVSIIILKYLRNSAQEEVKKNTYF